MQIIGCTEFVDPNPFACCIVIEKTHAVLMQFEFKAQSHCEKLEGRLHQKNSAPYTKGIIIRTMKINKDLSLISKFIACLLLW